MAVHSATARALTRRAGSAPPEGSPGFTLPGFFSVFRYSRRALELVWSTNRRLTIALAVFTVIAGVLPTGVALMQQLILDAAIAAIRAGSADATRVVGFVVLEGVLVAA